jgi:hypothetical protein
MSDNSKNRRNEGASRYAEGNAKFSATDRTGKAGRTLVM